jgi:hypothetical protein
MIHACYHNSDHNTLFMIQQEANVPIIQHLLENFSDINIQKDLNFFRITLTNIHFLMQDNRFFINIDLVTLPKMLKLLWICAVRHKQNEYIQELTYSIIRIFLACWDDTFDCINALKLENKIRESKNKNSLWKANPSHSASKP